MRCSSVAQTSTGLSGCWARSSATACSSFFQTPPALPAWPRPGGAGGASAPTSRSPSGPPSRVGVRPQRPEFTRHPARYLRAGPQATIRRRLTQTILELVQQIGPQDGGAGAVPAPQITQSLGTVGVIASPQTHMGAILSI